MNVSAQMGRLLGRLLGREEYRTIERVELSFGAPWADAHPQWVWLGCLALAALAGWFYLARQRGKHRLPLAVARSALLSLLLLVLAEPIASLKSTIAPKPLFWVLFDGTESMAIRDQLAPAEQARLAEAVDLPRGTVEQAEEGATRAEYVAALVRKKDSNLLGRLAEKARLRTFLFDRPEGVRALDIAARPDAQEDQIDPERAAGQLTTTGQVTALGMALADLGRRQAGTNVAGLLVVSDFDQNSGPAPLAAATKLGVPIYTLGVGPAAAQDVAADLAAPVLMKRAERSLVVVTLRQTGLDGETAQVKLTARPLGAAASAGEPEVIGQRSIELSGPTVAAEFPYTPDEPGRFVLEAEVEPLASEILKENNHVERETTVRDDFLRIMFVEYEPTWEWRFVKEVFHRDKLVGMRGFRTFLRSADPAVRRTNELFLQTLAPQRSEFFANDVIFLGDMPASTLSNRFCELTREFVSRFGGGLVVVAGPRFGPGQLAGTALADMLPVVLDPDATARDDREFPLRLTAEADQIDFMRLGADDAENAIAWNNLGRLPWYQPVARLHPLATALAVHPVDTCVDGKTPQPLVAIRRYGRGEVVYLGFNETWRLRRKFGERYYRQFWGQMIHRLGLNHAPGAQKRFVVRTDRQQYQPDDQALVTVEAYTTDFEPLSDENLPQRKLTAEVVSPSRDGGDGRPQPLGIPLVRDGVFEARVPLLAAGEHLVRVKDPITDEEQEVRFQVANLSVERRSAVRNVALERELALATGGRNYDLATVSRLPDDVDFPRKVEMRIEVFPLWNTWLLFMLVVSLMLGEWLSRKLVSLP